MNLRFLYKKRYLILVAVAIILPYHYAKYYILKNDKFLFYIAAHSDEPSDARYFALEQIYKNYARRGFSKELIYFLENTKNSSVTSCYIRVLGVVGKENAISFMKDTYQKYKGRRNFRSTTNYAIRSMGKLGNKTAIPFLEKLLNNEDEGYVLNATIACALYLLTGNVNFDYIDHHGIRQKLYLTERQIEARWVIVDSMGRKRTFEEMMKLEILYRPFDWPNE